MNRHHPISVSQLQQLLVKHGLVDPCAVNDPDGYDNWRTLALIGDLWRDLDDTFGMVQKRLDRLGTNEEPMADGQLPVKSEDKNSTTREKRGDARPATSLPDQTTTKETT